MIHRLCLCVALLALPGLCMAGAWPREEGRTFIATGAALLEKENGIEEVEQTFYVEYGLKKQRTLGFSGFINPSVSGEGHVFLRFAPRPRPSGALIAYELGVGVKSTDLITFRPFLKTGLSWSKGLTLGTRTGWLSLDGAAFFDLDHEDHRVKLDATFGLNMSDQFKLIGQGFAEMTQFGESLTLAPSIVYAPDWGPLSYQLGAEGKFGDRARTGLRFSVWVEF